MPVTLEDQRHESKARMAGHALTSRLRSAF